eukprot:11194004-Lingulodinium_polyedra.AAC.1
MSVSCVCLECLRLPSHATPCHVYTTHGSTPKTLRKQREGVTGESQPDRAKIAQKTRAEHERASRGP